MPLRILAFLAAVLAAALPAQSQPGFETPPGRVVVLDWALTEQVLDLDVVPAGVPETGLYRDWVVNPPLPDGIADVGLRTEPNLERIAALKPDVIIGADVPPEQAARLEQLAPLVLFDGFSAGHDNVAAARAAYLELAALFGRGGLAQERLAEMDAQIDGLAAELRETFGSGLQQAAAIRLNDAGSVWIYGDNSFPQAALKRLGLKNPLPQPASRWGVAQKPLEALAGAKDGAALLAIGPHMGGGKAMESPMWPFLPAVQANRFAEVAPVWSYGGILSLGRHAQAFRDALMTLEP